MKWVTRKHVHVDRVASPWLIKRFIDPDAVFKFVLWPGTTLSPEDGTPFDFPQTDIPFTHHDGKCTFEVLIDYHKLQDPVLDAMARIIHSADISKDIDASPEARGAELMLSGVAFLGDDDYEALHSGFILCDAMYTGLLLRLLREEYQKHLTEMTREERFQFLFKELRKRLPASIPVGPHQ